MTTCYSHKIQDDQCSDVVVFHPQTFFDDMVNDHLFCHKLDLNSNSLDLRTCYKQHCKKSKFNFYCVECLGQEFPKTPRSTSAYQMILVHYDQTELVISPKDILASESSIDKNSGIKIDNHDQFANFQKPSYPSFTKKKIKNLSKSLKPDNDVSINKSNEILSDKPHESSTSEEEGLKFSVTNEISMDDLFRDPCASDAPEFEPVAVYATYGDDLNIIRIHEAIRSRYAYQLAQSPIIRAKALENIEKLKSRQNILNMAEILSEIRYETQILAVAKVSENLGGWKVYLQETKPFILKYYFFQKSLNQQLEDLESQKIIIQKYLAHANDHIDIIAISQNANSVVCTLCGSLIKADNGSEEYEKNICQCLRESVALSKLSMFRETSRVDNTSRASYDDLTTFIKRLDAFEGKQRTTPSETLYCILDEFFLRNPQLICGMTCCDVRNLPLLPNGKKEGTSVAILSEALRATSNSSYYRDIDLIGHRLWGWRLADLTTSGLRELLIDDYKNTQRIYDRIKTRESSLNINLRLAAHLRSRKFECVLSDFKTVTGRDSLHYHEQCLSQMFKECGLPYYTLLE